MKPPSRRRVLQSAVAAPLSAAAARPTASGGSLTDVPGIKVGHWTSKARPTGCTAILTEAGAVAGIDVRGGAPGSRETELLRPEMTVDTVHAIVLSGGSAYGLAAADGVMRFLESKGVGFRMGRNVVPIVPAAILFDLGMGDGSIRPDADAGYKAAKAASDSGVKRGNVGAGAGATVGKLLGPGRSMKGGLGTASIRMESGLTIGALVAVNAVGDVVHPDTAEILAGALTEDRSGFADAAAHIRAGLGLGQAGRAENTTIGVVAANVGWTKAQATKVAQMAHDGLARAIRPAHMPFDGDTIFALGTGGDSVDSSRLGLIGALAADVLAQAIASAVLAAESVEGRPASRDIFKDGD